MAMRAHLPDPRWLLRGGLLVTLLVVAPATVSGADVTVAGTLAGPTIEAPSQPADGDLAPGPLLLLLVATTLGVLGRLAGPADPAPGRHGDPASGAGGSARGAVRQLTDDPGGASL